jgi:hypothetical protein
MEILHIVFNHSYIFILPPHIHPADILSDERTDTFPVIAIPIYFIKRSAFFVSRFAGQSAHTDIPMVTLLLQIASSPVRLRRSGSSQ